MVDRCQADSKPQRDRSAVQVASHVELRPDSADELMRVQRVLGQANPALWRLDGVQSMVAGCFIAFPRGSRGRGAKGDRTTAAAVLLRREELAYSTITSGLAGAPYEHGLLFLREGTLLEAAVRRLPERPEVLLVNGTGLDHPRRAGLALHMGALLDIPTVGVTHRPLCSEGSWPADRKGAMSPLLLKGEVVGYWLRTQYGARPLAVHAAWRTTPETAAAVVLATTGLVRTPEPIRLARKLARAERASARWDW